MRIECLHITLSVSSFKNAFTKKRWKNRPKQNNRKFPYKRSLCKEIDVRCPQNKSAIADILLCVRFTQFNHTQNHRSGRDNKHHRPHSLLNEFENDFRANQVFCVHYYILDMRCAVSRNEMFCTNARCVCTGAMNIIIALLFPIGVCVVFEAHFPHPYCLYIITQLHNYMCPVRTTDRHAYHARCGLCIIFKYFRSCIYEAINGDDDNCT